MSQANQVRLDGILSGGPSGLSYYSSTLQELLPVSFCDSYAGFGSKVESNLVSSDVSPFTIPLGTITKCRIFALRLLAGVTVKVNITTGLGVATFNVSDQLLLRCRNPGDEITAITLSTGSQTVDLAWLVAGDVS